MAEKFDAIIIGTGQSGPALAARMTRGGMKAAIIERKLFGGTCVNVGCIPTKTLVASARAAYMARRGADFGVMIDGAIRVDMAQVKARKDGVVRQSNEGVTNWLRNMKNLTVYEGHGRFESANTVRVNGDVLEADKIVLNVGARALVPDMPGIEGVDYLTNSSVMEVDFLPEHLIVIGGSYIGLEFAQMYRRFGSRVTVVEKGSALISRDDEDVSAAVKEIVENEGVDVRLNAECLTVESGASASPSSSAATTARTRSRARICCSRWGAAPTAAISGSTRPASRRTSAATSWSTTSSAPTFPASGPWATSTAAAPSRTPPTTTTRSSPPTCSTTIRAASPIASRPTRSTSIRPWAGSA